MTQERAQSASRLLSMPAPSPKPGKFLVSALMVASLMLALAQQAIAQSDGVTVTPTTLAGGKVITSEEARKLIDQKGILVIDTRSPVKLGKSHVPSAVSIAYKENSDKTASIVIYSDGPTGWKSYKGAVLAVKGGYKNVM